MSNNVPLELAEARIKNVEYVMRDDSAIHTINEVAPTNGELSVVNGISIVNGKLCVTYTKEVDD